MNSILEKLYGIIVHPVFALIIALLLVLLTVTGVIDKTVAICAALMWVAAFVWISRSQWMSQLLIGKRILVLAALGVALAISATLLFMWTLNQYHFGRSGHLHILTLVPQELAAGKNAQINVFYENTGDEPAEYVGDSDSLLLAILQILL